MSLCLCGSLLFLLLHVSATSALSQEGSVIRSANGVVVSASAAASRVGANVLANGGNAVDAAVATGFALAVTHPQAGNLGGSTFLLLRMADGRSSAIDARETAPSAAHADMYLDEHGEPQHDRSLYGPIAAGVPGTVDGLLLALQSYGSISREQALRPAIMLARDGFPLHRRLAAYLRRYHDEFRRYPETMRVFSRDGQAYREHDTLRQPDLAATLSRIAVDGRLGFYSGETARLLVEEMQRGGGIMTVADLRAYRAIEREALSGSYRGHDILTMPPVSSGGVAILQMLGMLEHFTLDETGYDARTVHLVTESMRRAFADRASWLGDPAFTDIPLGRLLSSEYLAAQAAGIDVKRATPSRDISSTIAAPWEGSETTHYSVVDRWGNAVAVTTTLNSSFGGKCVVPGTGMLLNNEMDDFSIKAGVPNQYGLLGNEANAIAPGKRMLSSMTPTIVSRGDTLVLVTGSPGGSRIITTVLETILNVVDFGMRTDRAVAAGRFHHQWYPDTLFIEPGAIQPAVLKALRAMGHRVLQDAQMGRVNAIGYDPLREEYIGVTDPRGYGAAVAPQPPTPKAE